MKALIALVALVVSGCATDEKEEADGSVTAPANLCGNGKIDADEECDNGSENSNDAADACREDCTEPRCGDGVKDDGEECDDGNIANGDGCESACMRPKWQSFYNTGGGLADHVVWAIAIDSGGGKWFGTSGFGEPEVGGVSHLSADNTTWTTFTTDNTGGGLVSNDVHAIAIDSAGGKWFGAEGGVSYWPATFGM